MSLLQCWRAVRADETSADGNTNVRLLVVGKEMTVDLMVTFSAVHLIDFCIWAGLCCCIAAIVNGETADDVYARVTEVIRDHSELVVWVPVYNSP